MQNSDPPTDVLAIEPDTRQEDAHNPVAAEPSPALPSAVFERRKEWAAWLKSKALSQK